MNIPGESAAYRAARDALLTAETGLRAEVERVAALRRALPDGPPPVEDYEFTDARTGAAARLSDLFPDGRDSLFLYGLMFAPAKGQGACPMCCAFLDALNGAAPHIADRIGLAVVAQAAPAELAALAETRDWRHLRLLSAARNDYGQRYGAETPEGGQRPIAHVWTRRSGEVRHFWASEMFTANTPDWPFHPRHVDMLWPLWNVLDLTPEGRGDAWFPRLSYD